MERRKKKVAHEDQRVSVSEGARSCFHKLSNSGTIVALESAASRLMQSFLLNTFKINLVKTDISCHVYNLPSQDVIRKTVEDKMKLEMEKKQKETKAAALSSQKTALDRFKK